MIYLDNAATSFPKPEPVYQAMDRFARTQLANPGRAGHRMAMEAEKSLDSARHTLNQFFKGETPDRWIFTHNCTDGLNMAIKGVLEPGDHAITTDLEHNSVSRPLRALEKAGFITLTRIESSQGYVDPDAIRQAINPKTKLIAITHAANAVGTVQPIEEIARIAREADVLLLVDAAQSAGVTNIDLKATPIDLLAFPGHKALYGPTGTGALYVGRRAKLRPWREGGTGGDSKSEVQPEDYPFVMEGGTPNVLGVAALAVGTDWVAEQGVAKLWKHEVGLLQSVVDWVEQSGLGWKIAGRWDPATHVGALSLIQPEELGMPPQDIATILDTTFNIAVRPGLHCAPYIHRNLGTFPDGTVRVSVGAFNTTEDIDKLKDALTEISQNAL